MTVFRTLLLVTVSACAAASTAAPPAPPADRAPASGAPAFRVEVSGHGPPMILIPGLASSGETWTTTVAHLRERYTCHVLTLAGFAGVPPTEGTLVPTVEAALVSYIASHNLVKPVVMGHSLGGELTLMLAADHPALVGPIVIVDSLPFLGAILGASTADEAMSTAGRIRAGMAAMPQPQYEAGVRSGQSTNALVTAPADRQRLIAWTSASDRATVADAMLALFGTDLRPVLPRVTAPALVIGTWIGWGSDPGARADAVARFHDQYAGLSRLHFAVTDTARHFVMFDDLPWFTRELDKFLADPDAAVRERGFAAL